MDDSRSRDCYFYRDLSLISLNEKQPNLRAIPPYYRSHLQTKVLQSADKICILSFLFTPHLCLFSPPPSAVVCCHPICICNLGSADWPLSLCSAPLCRVLQSVFAIWNLQTLSPALQLPSPPRAAICICNLWDLQTDPSPAAPLSPACCNLHLQSRICRLPPLHVALRCGDRDHFLIKFSRVPSRCAFAPKQAVEIVPWQPLFLTSRHLYILRKRSCCPPLVPSGHYVAG